jgi:hypothetical protein
MVNRCVNPACREEFKLLNAGDLYAHEKRYANTEFFWLCSACASRFDLRLDSLGRVTLRPRGDRALPPHPEGTLRLISRAVRPPARPHAVPSGERAATYVFVVGPLPELFRPRSDVAE